MLSRQLEATRACTRHRRHDRWRPTRSRSLWLHRRDLGRRLVVECGARARPARATHRRAGREHRQPGHGRHDLARAGPAPGRGSFLARDRRRADHPRHRHAGRNQLFPASGHSCYETGRHGRVHAARDGNQRGRAGQHLQRGCGRGGCRARRGAERSCASTTRFTTRATPSRPAPATRAPSAAWRGASRASRVPGASNGSTRLTAPLPAAHASAWTSSQTPCHAWISCMPTPT